MSTYPPEREYDDFDLPGCEEEYGDEHDAEPAEPEDDPECVVRLAEGSSDEEPELLEQPGAEDYSYFSNMTQADWDADNDWLASAGWGEM